MYLSRWTRQFPSVPSRYPSLSALCLYHASAVSLTVLLLGAANPPLEISPLEILSYSRAALRVSKVFRRRRPLWSRKSTRNVPVLVFLIAMILFFIHFLFYLLHVLLHFFLCVFCVDF